MKKKINASIIPVLIMSIAFIACNQETKKEEAVKTETTPMPAYDPEMDPIKVEAAFARVHADTLNVKLYEVALKPGDSVALHTHPDHIFYVIEGGKAEIKLKDAEAQIFDLKAGTGLVLGAQTHSGRNIGTTTIKILVADIYRPRG